MRPARSDLYNVLTLLLQTTSDSINTRINTRTKYCRTDAALPSGAGLATRRPLQKLLPLLSASTRPLALRSLGIRTQYRPQMERALSILNFITQQDRQGVGGGPPQAADGASGHDSYARLHGRNSSSNVAREKRGPAPRGRIGLWAVAGFPRGLDLLVLAAVLCMQRDALWPGDETCCIRRCRAPAPP